MRLKMSCLPILLSSLLLSSSLFPSLLLRNQETFYKTFSQEGFTNKSPLSLAGVPGGLSALRMRDKPSGFSHVFQPLAILNLDTLIRHSANICKVLLSAREESESFWWQVMETECISLKNASALEGCWVFSQDGPGCCRPRKHWSRDLTRWVIHSHRFSFSLGVAFSLFLLQTISTRWIT